MSEPDDLATELPKKKSKLPLLVGMLLAALGGSGGYYAASTGLILGSESHHGPEVAQNTDTFSDIVFVPIDPMVVSLRTGDAVKQLMFRASLEVPIAYQSDVEKLMPRVVDVLNSYLRAIEPSDLQDRSALARLRGHMLRRVQIVIGDGRINDLLIMEFVLT